MKYKMTITLFILLLVTACEIPTEPEITIHEDPIEEEETIEEPQTLSGQWLRQDVVIQFYDNLEFTFHDYYTLDELYYGFYIDYGDTVYLEVYADGMNMTYEYVIVVEYADTILRWKSAGMINTVDYVLID